MKRAIILLAFSALLLLPSAGLKALTALPEKDYSWEASIRKDHPRLFLNKQDIPRIKKNAAGSEKFFFDAMKKRIDPLLNEPIVFKDLLIASGESSKDHEWGTRASESAMLWLITGDRKYLDYTKNLLTELAGYYQFRCDHNLNITWYAFSQICAICAYDWVYNNLDKNERADIGRALFKALDDIAWHNPPRRKPRQRENVSDHMSGCYGPPILSWYLGLAFLGDGIDDEECRKMLHEGYDLFQKMSVFRAEMAGEKGGGATACATYAFGYYPYADFNFIYTMKSATGIDVSESMTYVLGYLKYLDWIRLPYNREFGFGDVHHYNCMLPERDINAHIFHINNIYSAAHPEILPVAERLLKQFSLYRDIEPFPFLRLLKGASPKTVQGAEAVASMAKSIYFDTMGQVYMRSGTGDDDTYVLFVSGGVPLQHKHYDNNHFIIYKKGWRTVDSGTRPEPGIHLSHYYCRTVAHNCITIRMPGEVMPAYWGGPALCEEQDIPIPNDGGQCEKLGSKLLELTETPDWVYLASDATPCYHPAKASKVVREFIWFCPDLFVVMDRVASKDASYPKTWLWHTIEEPKALGPKEWKEASEGGAMICRTLLPEDAAQELIGGPGKDFWSDGRNWPLPVLCPDDWGYGKRHIVPPETHPQLGHWRLEVAPGKPAEEDIFLHMMLVGDKDLASMPSSTLKREGKAFILSFQYGGKSFTLNFDTEALYGCKIDAK